MKSAIGFAGLLAQVALASYDSGAWRYSYRQSDVQAVTSLSASDGYDVETILYQSADSSIVWKLRTYTAYDADDGIEYIRFENILTAPIKATDEVSFEIAFTTGSDPWTNKQLIAEDSMVCKMTQSTQNTALWTQTAEDKYYFCTGDSDCYYTAVTSPTYTFEAASDAADALDWTIPLEDDDEDNPYCTPYDSTTHANEAIDFACQEIKCIAQRPMDTGDSTDFQLSTSNSAGAYEVDKIYIGVGRALLGLNEAGCSTYCVQMEALLKDATANTKTEISVYHGALSLASQSLFAATVSLLLTAF